MQRPELVQGDLNPWCRSSGQTITLTKNGQRDDPKRDSLIRLENSLIRRFNSLFVLISQYGGNHGARSIAYASLPFD